MSVIQYETYLDVLNNAQRELSYGQQERFKALATAVDRGEMTMNQAYKEAVKDFSNANGEQEEGYKGNFNSWIQTAQQQGWIDKGLNLIQSLAMGRKDRNVPYQPTEPPKKSKTLTWVAVGVGVVAVGGLIYLIATRDK